MRSSGMSSSKESSASDSPGSLLRVGVFVGQDGCEHQVFMQPPKIIHGEGLDEGTVAIQVGEACILFNSTDALINGLTRPDVTSAATDGSTRQSGAITNFAVAVMALVLAFTMLAGCTII